MGRFLISTKQVRQAPAGFNRGSWHVKKGSRFCIQKNNSMQSVLAQLSGTIIDGKELVVWINMELWKAGLYTHENKCVELIANYS